MNSPGPSATDIQSHLYNSFIHASTYDVAIRVSGRTWRAIYKLHRVVLIQSGFFRSLFTAGFSESQAARRSGTDEINVTFDDCNITRPAFEICISRLYGGGPPLFVSPNLIPTTEFPLTPPFSGTFQPDQVPPGYQPANHRFLLSLLATSIYLSIPSVAAQTLSLILKTVGPTTIRDYLNFACGTSLIILDSQTADVLPAVGLENIADQVEEDDDTESTTHKQFTKEFEVIGSLSSIDISKQHFSTIDPEGSSPDSEESGDESITRVPSCHYGKLSDKIGEACACWLTRWAFDMLQIENEDCSNVKDDCGFLGVNSGNTTAQGSKNLPIRLLIWRRGGLTAKWVSAVLSADTLFVKNERERYNLARTVVEFRRRDGIIDDEESIWKDLFEHGIHYTNMTFEDLRFISQDTSPSTRQLYVPLRILQAAYWNQSILRSHITSRPSSVNASSGGILPSLSKDKELSIFLNTTDILSQIAVAGRGGTEQRYFTVFGDQSIRIGDGGNNLSPSSMEDLFNSFHQLAPKHGRTGTGQEQVIPMGSIITTEEKFFGILTPRFLGHDCVNADDTGKARWSPYPPYRFSVEFWDVDLLKEKSRLHSQTIWYAGSLFNVYVQLVRKKGQLQLGIYLHRQSHVDPIPTSSMPPPTIPKKEESLDTTQALSQQRQSLPPTISQSQYPANHYAPSSLPVTSIGTPANQRNSSPTSPPSRPCSPPNVGSIPQSTSASHPYRDQRSSITAYFAISCASATGSSQTRFSSSPDTFSVSQSWGWKSSSLRTEEFLEVGANALPSNIVRGKEVSLRATVVLGLV